MNRRWLLLAAAPVAALGLLAACSDDDPAGTPDPGGAETGTPETGGGFEAGPGSDSSIDQNVPDGAVDAALTPTVLTRFNPTFGELPEGVTVLRADGGAGTPLVGFAGQGRIVSVLGDGGYQQFAEFAGNVNGSFFMLGMTVDAANNVYVAVADTSGGAAVPAAGVYKIAATDATHTPTPYATPAAAQAFEFVNGLDFIGTDLFIADSSGTIFKTDNLGVTTVWLSANVGIANTALAGDVNDCKLPNGFPIGVNGITHDATNLYAVNTDKGTLLKIPLGAGNAPGAIAVVKKDPALCGVDGVVLDKDGTFLVANNGKSSIQRVTAQGVITTVFAGKPLDGPASLWIDTQGTTRRLLVTNSAFGSAGADGGVPQPSLVSFTLP